MNSTGSVGSFRVAGGRWSVRRMALVVAVWGCWAGLASAAVMVDGLRCEYAVNPVGMQYSAEVVRPVPEGSSNGLVSLAGQASVLLVYAMEALNAATGTFTASLLASAFLLALSAFLATRLHEGGTGR